MPRYFFHVRSNGELTVDQKGLEISDPTFFQSQCAIAMNEIVNEDEFRQREWPGHEFQIVDDRGTIVLILPFKVPGD